MKNIIDMGKYSSKIRLRKMSCDINYFMQEMFGEDWKRKDFQDNYYQVKEEKDDVRISKL